MKQKLAQNKQFYNSGASSQESVNARDSGLIPGSGRALRVGNSNPLQYSSLENAMDRGAWRATVRGISKSWTQLSN